MSFIEKRNSHPTTIGERIYHAVMNMYNVFHDDLPCCKLVSCLQTGCFKRVWNEIWVFREAICPKFHPKVFHLTQTGPKSLSWKRMRNAFANTIAQKQNFISFGTRSRKFSESIHVTHFHSPSRYPNLSVLNDLHLDRDFFCTFNGPIYYIFPHSSCLQLYHRLNTRPCLLNAPTNDEKAVQLQRKENKFWKNTGDCVILMTEEERSPRIEFES